MDKELIENISKISFFDTKVEKVESLLKEEKYSEGYKAVAALIEMISIIVLEKIHNVKVEDSNIITLISLFRQYKEKEIEEYLIDINGEYNSIQLNKIKELDVMSLLGNLDDLAKIILDKYGNIF